MVDSTSMLSTSIGSCGGAFGGDVDVFGFTLAPDGGRMSSFSSMIIGEVRDPIPRKVIAGELKRDGTPRRSKTRLIM